ncbi:spore germination protein [Bacillus massiliigorillae]|uniref:spore germination protein n=1 Tax=Bacillus massiliigorillae TaxID=1243664 RepID=UPI0003A9EB47|nr:spore germination protein [Bacillus massiliigorillae]
MFFKRKKKKKIYVENEINDDKHVSSTLNENISYIKEKYNYTDDLQTRYFKYNDNDAVIVYIDTICDAEIIQNGLLSPLNSNTIKPIEEIITIPDVKTTIDLNKAINMLNKGICILIIEQENNLYLINSSKPINRSPDEPISEKVVRGSHEGFVESIDININLVRKRIKSRQLTVKYKEMGTEENNKVALLYMNDLVDPNILKIVEKRLNDVSSDMIFTPGFLEEFIEDKPFSPFPQTLYTERPDRGMAHLLDGRIILMADGSAEVLILPITFFAFFQTPDDYNSRVFTATVYRFLRLMNFIISISFPAFYIATIAYHFEIIPNDIILLVKNSVEGIPFPPLVEAIIMLVTIELIREAGVRLPTPIGQTIGIVGGLIIGDAIIKAGLISNVMVIIIAITSIASFTIPSYEMSNSLRTLAYPFMIAAATLGFVGIVFLSLFIAKHLCKLESYGKPYFAPFAPFHLTNLKDTFVRFPNWMFSKRPLDANPKKVKKQSKNRKWDNNDS